MILSPITDSPILASEWHSRLSRPLDCMNVSDVPH